jgi:4'-phosphopantetheinyl transferase EntD
LALADLFGPGVVLLEAPAAIVDPELYAEELAAVAGAVSSRRAEFGTARVLARRALARIGVAPAPLVAAEGRGPTWPSGSVGCIAHTHGHCAVVVGPRPPLRSIGIDVEVLRPLEPDVVDLVLTAPEKAWLMTQPAARRADLAMTFFCAKEAYYKCQHPLTRAFLEFGDVEVDLHPEDGTFDVRLLARPMPPETARLRGRFAFENGRVLCGVEVRA